MNTDEFTVFLIDDDPAIRKTLPRGLIRRGFTVESFESAQLFLESYSPDRPGCLLLDLSMPDMSGLELQKELRARNIVIPIIFMTGHGGVQESVLALRAGAIDFLEKPFPPETLVSRLEEASIQDRKTRSHQAKLNAIQARFARLTGREREILNLLMASSTVLSSKEIARELGISYRTVEHHRSRVLEKTRTSSIAELKMLATQHDMLPTHSD